MEGIGEGIFGAIIMLCILCVVVVWGGWEMIDWLFIDNAIRVSDPIVPEIELVIKNNIVDTIYVYQEPN